MRWSGATGAIARCNRVSTGCGRKRTSVPAWPWICGVKPKPKAVNKPSPHSIVHGLDKPGGFTTVSNIVAQLPKMTEDYDKLRQDTARARAGKETEFRLGWEPFIRFALAEFDKRISELRANGISGDGGGTDTFPITSSNVSNANTNYQVRAVSFGGKSVL